MKTTITKKLLGLALSVFSITALAQCPTITNMNVGYGANGTATVTPVLSSPTSTMTLYYWQISPNGTLTSSIWSQNGTFQFPANGSYTLTVSVLDSINGCSTAINTVVNITNMPASTCNADFNYYTDSSCVTHFVNTSIGTNLTYSWYINSSLYTSVNPSVGFPNGTYPAVLYTYSAGNFCDSTSQYITISCGGGATTTPCQASFSYYTDSTTCLTHFVNTTPCTYSTSSWVISGTTYYTANPVLSLTNGMHSVTLNTSIVGGGINTSTNVIYVSCNSGTTTPACQTNASFYVFADSTNAGNYFAYNYSSGTGTLSYLWNFGDGTSSTQQYPFHQYAIPGQYVICLTVTATSGTTTCSDTYCDSSSVQRMAAGFQMSQFNVIPLSVTGIKQTEKEIGLKAFPNPIADELTIEAIATNNNILTYVLVDALGRMVSTGILNNSKTTINTSNLEKGFYSLSVKNEKGNNLKTIKLVK